jgi:hypothetical protein
MNAMVRWIRTQTNVQLKFLAGPIIRITPEEIHIKDSGFWDSLYIKHPKASRHSDAASRFGNNDSVFAVADASIHRKIRAPLNPLYAPFPHQSSKTCTHGSIASIVFLEGLFSNKRISYKRKCECFATASIDIERMARYSALPMPSRLSLEMSSHSTPLVSRTVRQNAMTTAG